MTQKSSSYDLFSDFEGTIVLPEVSYRDWVSSRVEDREKFETEWESRLKRAKEEWSTSAWESYLDLYSKLFTLKDFKEISLKYSINKIFESWCSRFLKAHGYERANLTVVTRGFAPVAKNFFDRTDIKRRLSDLKITVGSVIGSEPYIDKLGVMKGLKSVICMKRKFVKDGHIMLGDEGEEKEFGSYPYFVNLSKWKTG
ncbi:MAG: hypothetical protein JRN52_11635 [Nitrososphaerota archaeon]|nr:hypothetical protein [Nitrososphaerota archaeon]